MFPWLNTLSSPTLKHLREKWWNSEFTEFLTETLQPRSGDRILDVGCGEGTAEVSIGRLQVSQLDLFGIDLRVSSVAAAKQEAASHNLRAAFAAADACFLPFRDGVFDSTFCVAVLQHVDNVDHAVHEFARVTRRGGRVLAVEPDNAARYFYGSTPSAAKAFASSQQFFAAMTASRNGGDAAIGPKIPLLFARHGIEPVGMRLFPVSNVQLTGLPPTVWAERRARAQRFVDLAASDELRELGRQYLDALDAYASDARAAGSTFVEIQNATLFATVGQKGK
jgi:SAM-dependent methyltransferase